MMAAASILATAAHGGALSIEAARVLSLQSNSRIPNVNGRPSVVCDSGLTFGLSHNRNIGFKPKPITGCSNNDAPNHFE